MAHSPASLERRMLAFLDSIGWDNDDTLKAQTGVDVLTMMQLFARYHVANFPAKADAKGRMDKP